MSDVKEKVLKYISVMARPMVLHKEHHVRWTGVYADVDVDKGYQFVTSASIPVFNKRPHMVTLQNLKRKEQNKLNFEYFSTWRFLELTLNHILGGR